MVSVEVLDASMKACSMYFWSLQGLGDAVEHLLSKIG
jgi:hypothetical protein